MARLDVLKRGLGVPNFEYKIFICEGSQIKNIIFINNYTFRHKSICPPVCPSVCNNFYFYQKGASPMQQIFSFWKTKPSLQPHIINLHFLELAGWTTNSPSFLLKPSANTLFKAIYPRGLILLGSPRR